MRRAFALAYRLLAAPTIHSPFHPGLPSAPDRVTEPRLHRSLEPRMPPRVEGTFSCVSEPPSKTSRRRRYRVPLGR